jgi:hypothetical protein
MNESSDPGQTELILLVPLAGTSLSVEVIDRTPHFIRSSLSIPTAIPTKTWEWPEDTGWARLGTLICVQAEGAELVDPMW